MLLRDDKSDAPAYYCVLASQQTLQPATGIPTNNLLTVKLDQISKKALAIYGTTGSTTRTFKVIGATCAVEGTQTVQLTEEPLDILYLNGVIYIATKSYYLSSNTQGASFISFSHTPLEGEFKLTGGLYQGNTVLYGASYVEFVSGHSAYGTECITRSDDGAQTWGAISACQGYSGARRSYLANPFTGALYRESTLSKDKGATFNPTSGTLLGFASNDVYYRNDEPLGYELLVSHDEGSTKTHISYAPNDTNFTPENFGLIKRDNLNYVALSAAGTIYSTDGAVSWSLSPYTTPSSQIYTYNPILTSQGTQVSLLLSTTGQGYYITVVSLKDSSKAQFPLSAVRDLTSYEDISGTVLFAATERYYPSDTVDILKSVDGGLQWTKISTIDVATTKSQFYNLYALSTTHLVVELADISKNYKQYFLDIAGSVVTKIKPGCAYDNLYLTNHQLYLGKIRGANRSLNILYSINKNGSCTPINSLRNVNTYLSDVNSKTMYAVRNSALVSSQDSGKTWKDIYTWKRGGIKTGTISPTLSLDKTSSKHIVLIDDNYKIFESKNSGKSFSYLGLKSSTVCSFSGDIDYLRNKSILLNCYSDGEALVSLK